MFTIHTFTVNGAFAIDRLDHVPSLGDIKRAIGGGHIETVPYFSQLLDEPCVVFCDEDGKIKGQFPNRVATYLWYADLSRQSSGEGVLEGTDYLAGTVAIITADNPADLSFL